MRKGTIAVCSRGAIGLITENQPREVEYSDGTKAIAWVGVHLTDEIAPVGSPWSSRYPIKVGELSFITPINTYHVAKAFEQFEKWSSK